MGLVQERARLSTRQEALMATRATLETLGERVPAELSENVASQLPAEVGRMLTGFAGTPERFGFNEFVERVSEREGSSDSQATFHARAVFDVLGDAVTPGSQGKLKDALPGDLRRLLVAGANGKM